MKKVRLILLRIVLAILIALNLAAIFGFSGENAAKSAETSSGVTRKVAEVTVPDFEAKPVEEQESIVKKMDPPIRKLAHMTEYASLGALIFLLLLTWKGAVLWRYATAIGLSAAYAVTDELHQKFSFGRSGNVLDFSIDTSGAFISCTLLLLLYFLVLHLQKRGKRIETTTFTVPCAKITQSVRLAVIADLHGNRLETLPALLQKNHPDIILIPGDLTDYRAISDNDSAIFDFLRMCVSIAPTFYSIGNHETGCFRHGNPFAKPQKKVLPPSFEKNVAQTGAVLLQNAFAKCGELVICGLDSGLDGRRNEPDYEAMQKFAACEGYRVLLCHHPEYYFPFIRNTDIDLTVSGHAHGGHWRFFGHGVYAPEQGLFPKFTSGLWENRFVISRGLGNHTKIPRIHNPRELVIVDLIAG